MNETLRENTSTFRTDINALRAFAVAVVVLYHANELWAGGGFVGVDIFFVISGFLMTRIIVSSHENKGFSFIDFYKARVARIVPALISLIGLMLLIGYVFLDPVDYANLGKHAASSLGFFSNIVYWTESGYFDSSSKQKWLLHTWSLSTEWQFYLLYPILILAILKWTKTRKRQLIAMLSVTLLSFTLACIATEWLNTGKSSSFAFYMLPTRAWEMLVGGLVFFLSELKQSKPQFSYRANLIPWGILVTSVIFIPDTLPWPGMMTLIPVLSCCWILYANQKYKYLTFSPIQNLGKISYSVYLWHWPLMLAISKLAFFSPVAAALIAIGITLILSALSYVYIEKPATKLINGAKLGSLKMGLVSTIAVLVFISSSFIWFKDGIYGRVAGNISTYKDAQYASKDRDYPDSKCGGIRFGQLRVCELNPEITPSIALIGDSFVEMWYGRISQLTKDKQVGVDFYTLGGCPPIAGVYRKGYGTDCAAAHQLQVEKIINNAAYKTIIIGSMWTSYFAYGRNDVRILVNGNDTNLASDAGFQQATSIIKGEMQRFIESGKRVVILTTVPYPKKDIPDQLRRQIFFNHPTMDDRFDFSSTLISAYPIDAFLVTLANKNIEVINSLSMLCKDSICQSAENNISRYSDGAHLRGSFIRNIDETPLDKFFKNSVILE